MRKIDLTGKVFGRLTVQRFHGYSKHQAGLWLCKCDCGKEKVVLYGSLTYGSTKSCGCLVPALSALKATIHGRAGTPEHRAWSAMRTRCNNKLGKTFKYYGGRGITVCDRWAEFKNFYEDMGDRPKGMSLDRIDVQGNYEPSNCRWATHKVQMNNTTRNRFLLYLGQMKTVSEWADVVGIPIKTISCRINKHKWTISDALTRQIKRKEKTNGKVATAVR